ncbi:MAG: hypothetical protein VB855_20320 [Pirellulaceae bacterium]
MNILVTVVVIFFVTLAMAQIVIFDLTKESEQHLPPSVFRLHKTIGHLGIGAAGYALFGARWHFSPEGWILLVVSVLGIVLVGVTLIKAKKKWANPADGPASDGLEEKTEEEPEQEIETELKASDIFSPEPNPDVVWCAKCRAHTHSKDGQRSTRSGSVSVTRCRRCEGEMWRPNSHRLTAKIFGWITVVVGSVMLLGAGFLVANLEAGEEPWWHLLILLLCPAGLAIVFVGTPALVWHLHRHLYRLWKKWARETTAAAES